VAVFVVGFHLNLQILHLLMTQADPRKVKLGMEMLVENPQGFYGCVGQE